MEKGAHGAASSARTGTRRDSRTRLQRLRPCDSLLAPLRVPHLLAKYRRSIMVFTKRLREGIRSGRIKCSVRIWMRPHVKAGGRYRMDEGQIVVDSIQQIR